MEGTDFEIVMIDVTFYLQNIFKAGVWYAINEKTNKYNRDRWLEGYS